MTPTEIYPIRTMMTTRTTRTTHRVSQRHRPATILFVDQNCCGSHIIWNNMTMKTRLPTNSDNWDPSKCSHPIHLGCTKTIGLCRVYVRHSSEVTQNSCDSPKPVLLVYANSCNLFFKLSKPLTFVPLSGCCFSLLVLHSLDPACSALLVLCAGHALIYTSRKPCTFISTKQF